VWDDALAVGRENGFRNSQISVLAPTGTIGFLMDCDTTGVEPDIAIVKYKSLVGGGMFKIVNQTVPEALERLGYSAASARRSWTTSRSHDTIEGAPGLGRRAPAGLRLRVSGPRTARGPSTTWATSR
jgi:ribonucleoside-diphosphate reductase alpha chain